MFKKLLAEVLVCLYALALVALATGASAALVYYGFLPQFNSCFTGPTAICPSSNEVMGMIVLTLALFIGVFQGGLWVPKWVGKRLTGLMT